MKVLVLGGTGAIGVPLINLLSENRDIEVYVTSRNELQDINNIRYIKGNAKDLFFLQSILKEKWDVIFDFMVYSTREFEVRYNLFLDNTKQYFFFSSARCFANSVVPLNENSPRLIDVCDDKDYLSTDEYALAKGKQENLLFNSQRKNWTIVRPYITYNNFRLQLGVYEKEQWLWRTLHKKTIIMPRDILETYTTLTSGDDVARILVSLMNNKNAYGQSFNVASDEAYKWEAILNMYVEIIKEKTNLKPKIKIIPSSNSLCKIWNKWQIQYDRLYSRKFDTNKIKNTIGQIDFIDPKIGLRKSLTSFLDTPKWLNINIKYEAWCDKQSHEITPLKYFKGIRNKIKYIKYRFFIQ